MYAYRTVRSVMSSKAFTFRFGFLSSSSSFNYYFFSFLFSFFSFVVVCWFLLLFCLARFMFKFVNVLYGLNTINFLLDLLYVILFQNASLSSLFNT